jgi:nitronate monooxygenase
MPCDHGQESNRVGYCIADALGDSQRGIMETGLFFSGSNGYRVTRLQSVQELMEKLAGVREDTDTWEEDPNFIEMPDTPPTQQAVSSL